MLGDYDAAETKLRQSDASFTRSDWGRFLETQIHLFRRTDFVTSVRQLLRLRDTVSRDAYLNGEIELLLGYAHLLLDRYQRSLGFHRRAAEHYGAAGLPAHVANCWFNLCIAFQNLNRRESLREYSRRLTDLAKAGNDPSVLHLHYRNQASWTGKLLKRLRTACPRRWKYATPGGDTGTWGPFVRP